jgi:hypothetical protein
MNRLGKRFIKPPKFFFLNGTSQKQQRSTGFLRDVGASKRAVGGQWDGKILGYRLQPMLKFTAVWIGLSN